MPRPGPRPYECVRRAWHSDRHQPIRGSLIQEIFRIVNQVHCSATRKNREWQEKLPIVVLKAEEIMYSKANSEAEYSDLKTLWDRVNDAIDTIIRRDETSETGDFLQPCIEAALHLGCTPKRSSRSQRNDSPRYYLRPQSLDDSSVPHSNSPISSPLLLPYQQYSALEAIKPLHSNSKAENRNVQTGSKNPFEEFLLLPKNFSPSDNHNASVRSYSLSDTYSIYPLCYDNQVPTGDPKLCSLEPSPSNSNLMQSDNLGLQQNISSSKHLDSPKVFFPPSKGHSSSKEHGSECDLTLRLGSSSGSMC